MGGSPQASAGPDVRPGHSAIDVGHDAIRRKIAPDDDIAAPCCRKHDAARA